MQPHPHICKTIKWGGAAATVLLVVVWIWSGWRFEAAYTQVGTYGLEIDRGRLCFRSPFLMHFPRGWPAHIFLREPPAPAFRVDWGISIRLTGAAREFALPIWMLALLTCLAAAIAWRLDVFDRRHARVGKCVKCSYDRRGLSGDAVCPECGAPSPSEQLVS